MAAQVLTLTPPPSFPTVEVARRLQMELEQVANEASVLRPAWELLLDSQRVVGTVLAIEDLFPSFRIPPDKVVRKGGYSSVNEAVTDMLIRIERIVTQSAQLKVAK